MSTYNELNIIDKYLDEDDITKHNSNFIYSLPCMNSMISGELSKRYWFKKVFGPQIERAHDEGLVYLHNLDVLGPYCSGYSAMDVAEKGLNSLASNSPKISPPRHVHSLLGQSANFISIISQEIHGACAINDLTSVVASYLYIEEVYNKETITDKQIDNAWQDFIFEVNLSFRSGNSPFSNITISVGGPDPVLKGKPVMYGGDVFLKEDDTPLLFDEIPKEYYDRVTKIFIDVFRRGDAENKPFTFPLISVNVDDEFDFDNPIFEYLLDASDDWGGFYLENYRNKPFDDIKNEKYRLLNKYIKKRSSDEQRSFCCRFQISLEEIQKLKDRKAENANEEELDEYIASKKDEMLFRSMEGSGSVFRSSSGVGGVGVFNINLNRLGYIAQGCWDDYYKMLTDLLYLLAEAATKRREFILKNKKLYPYFFYFNTEGLDNYFNVISICGGHESLINMGIDNGILSEEGIKKANEIATYIRDMLKEFTIKNMELYSLEYAPAESASPRLAKKDLEFSRWLDKVHQISKPKKFLQRFKNFIFKSGKDDSDLMDQYQFFKDIILKNVNSGKYLV